LYPGFAAIRLDASAPMSRGKCLKSTYCGHSHRNSAPPNLFRSESSR
jgi:hypothetical protein